ncbi:hypothetical protein [Trichothermofontia sp.]
MTTELFDRALMSLKRHIADYLPYLEKAQNAIKILESTDPDSEEFSQALADLQVAATVLEPASQGMLLAIEGFTESRPE